MPTLYRFGIDPSDPSAKAIVPTPIVTDEIVEISWSSWCDLIYTVPDDVGRLRSRKYLGTSLDTKQKKDLEEFCWEHGSVHFFGTDMHEGVRGCLDGEEIHTYNTEAMRAKEGSMYRNSSFWKMRDSTNMATMCSNGSVLFAEPQMIGHVADLHDFRRYCNDWCYRDVKERRGIKIDEISPEKVASFGPTQLVVNATTATALDQEGRVYTRTTDPRYPACLGRAYTGTSMFEPVPYLSETRITKIASGGYMTAAISEDGELFLWGQANPGSKEELGVLHRLDYTSDAEEGKKTTIQSDAIADDDVKCLAIHIHGRVATAYDVAVGFGHVLVAAKDDSGSHTVLAAGCGSEGQLGIPNISEYCEEFREVEGLRGNRVVQMEASGWSSFVVTGEEVK
ncbi:hypothetical protein E8E13_007801 [Curvularia kusanoi]|uniref:Uncharacterized protein n=1 Tax=Curvularia kusanoi TaxID=90978 RepID=A0A9P4TM10_CURKU|nr:hypothetical protein E8E13_007801 [Curvularia kusanoi]